MTSSSGALFVPQDDDKSISWWSLSPDYTQLSTVFGNNFSRSRLGPDAESLKLVMICRDSYESTDQVNERAGHVIRRLETSSLLSEFDNVRGDVVIHNAETTSRGVTRKFTKKQICVLHKIIAHLN
jgi:hypothetical protein